MAFAAYVTAEDRLKLYEYLIKLCDSVLYCFTDSVIYIQNVDKPSKVKTAYYLSDLTDELVEFGPGSYIEQSVSGDPKNYAFSVFSHFDRKAYNQVQSKGDNPEL